MKIEDNILLIALLIVSVAVAFFFIGWSSAEFYTGLELMN
jgi:hypothetical protein